MSKNYILFFITLLSYIATIYFNREDIAIILSLIIFLPSLILILSKKESFISVLGSYLLVCSLILTTLLPQIISDTGIAIFLLLVGAVLGLAGFIFFLVGLFKTDDKN